MFAPRRQRAEWDQKLDQLFNQHDQYKAKTDQKLEVLQDVVKQLATDLDRCREELDAERESNLLMSERMRLQNVALAKRVEAASEKAEQAVAAMFQQLLLIAPQAGSAGAQKQGPGST